MKIITNIEKSLAANLAALGVIVERQPYNTIAEAYFDQGDYDACVIDLDTEDAEGIYSARSLISSGVIAPIIGISYDLYVSEVWRENQATFLEQGGMYLLENPCNIRLLCACIKQAKSLVKGNVVKKATLKYCDDRFVINLNSGVATFDSVRIHLTQKEYGILQILAESKNRICSKEYILQHLYALSNDDEPELKIIDVFVCKLRAKLKEADPLLEELIRTVWGKGYTFDSSNGIETKAFAQAS